MPNYQQRAGFLNEGLLMSMWRGWEGTGLALVPHGKEKEKPYVYKDNICAFDFCNRQFVARVLNKIDEFSIVLGHTRSATRGTSTARNAHPFQHNHITSTHNGTVGNAYDIVPIGARPHDVNVDSDIVCYAMGALKEKEDEEQILEKLKGPF